jgi:dipeptidyl aminopeptidase/acylaminoacyl peptidase
MKIARIVSVLALMALWAPAQERPMTFDDILKLNRISDPRISPDGRKVAFVVTRADLESNLVNSDIWVVGTDGGEPIQLTRSPKRDDQPRWSPDSRHIAFVSDRDGKAQLYVMPVDGGEPERLTNMKAGVQGFAWSPDGRRIAFIAADSPSEKPDGFDQIVVDAEYQYAHIYLLEVKLGNRAEVEPVKLTDGALHAVELAWSPDGKRIAFAARSTPKLADLLTTEVYVIDAQPGPDHKEPRRLTNNDRAESAIAWSPDGRMVSFLATSDTYPTIGPPRIHLIAANGQQLLILNAKFDGYVRNYEWSGDGRYIYLSADISLNRHIYALSSDGAKFEQLSRGEGLWGPLTLSKSNRIAYLKEGATYPADLWAASIEHGAAGLMTDQRQLTRMNPQVASIKLGRVEAVRWKSRDGRQIEGILILPIDYRQGQRCPLIVSVHGGPEGAYMFSFMASYSEFPHIYAARGYACFFPNFRGSSNYGAEFASANVGDLGGGDSEDIMSGVDYVIEQGVADPDRLGIKGWSYGGYMSAWIISHTTRFKAAAFGAGLSNAISYYSQADIQYSRETLHQGNPWRNNKNMLERSPVFYLQSARTPSLIFHGEKDERVPLPQSLETYMGLKKAGVPVQLIIYPREPHSLREPKHQLDKMRRELEWFEKHIWRS